MKDEQITVLAGRVAAILAPRLRDELAEAVARRVVEPQRTPGIGPIPCENTEPLFTRDEAAAYLRLSVRTFDRERQRRAEILTPAAEVGPLAKKFRKSTLDLYKMGGCIVRPRRRRITA